ncbi:hypothetical protein TRAPUB_12624 [Trametes pubescens]|uniref:Uncharacterized protein n=1 Tax=Trametes pubescens TaxID=154538 RepID=A0A1M2VTF3_TRAPU|nr:hypothetical protein TRAPUB_12624 [Trametes pubescens]
MTLSPKFHTFFDNLKLFGWRRLLTREQIRHRHPGYPRPAPEYLPLPDPQILGLHAACCKVAHMSGTAEYIATATRDMEQIKVLAEDGGSADVLTYAMSRLVAPVPPLYSPALFRIWLFAVSLLSKQYFHFLHLLLLNLLLTCGFLVSYDPIHDSLFLVFLFMA